jgi:flagellar hook-associated protein 1 FlgK
MGSTFLGLEIAKSGLFLSQNAMNVSSHNIANVDTDGFTRQRIYAASVPGASNHVQFATDKSGLSGRGVTAVCVEQIRSPFLDYQYRNQNSSSTRWSTKEQFFSYIEDLFNTELDDNETVSSSISSQLGDFYDSLYKLVESPADIEIRTNVQQNALKLTQTMNYYFKQLTDQQNTLNENVDVTVDQINQYAQEISDLNEAILGYELSGDKANDLRDKRNLLLDQLSGLIDISYSEESNGNVNVQIDGNYLVRGSSYNKLAVAATKDNPVRPGAANRLYEVYWADSSGAATGKKVNVNAGALKAYMEVRDGNTKEDVGIPYILGQLNALCQKITNDVNAIHRTGYTTPNDSNGNTSQTGINFFMDTSAAQDGSEVTAENFKLSTEVMQNVYNIAASDITVGPTGAPNEQRGNGQIALKLSELINHTDASGNPDNFGSAYKTIVTGVGLQLSNISSTAEVQAVMVDHLIQQRKSISDVSLDEEMTNIIKFSHAYSAASRMITAMDEQLNVLINSTGLVGRG